MPGPPRAGLRAQKKTVRGKRGSVQRTYWVKSSPDLKKSQVPARVARDAPRPAVSAAGRASVADRLQQLRSAATRGLAVASRVGATAASGYMYQSGTEGGQEIQRNLARIGKTLGKRYGRDLGRVVGGALGELQGRAKYGAVGGFVGRMIGRHRGSKHGEAAVRALAQIAGGLVAQRHDYTPGSVGGIGAMETMSNAGSALGEKVGRRMGRGRWSERSGIGAIKGWLGARRGSRAGSLYGRALGGELASRYDRRGGI